VLSRLFRRLFLEALQKAFDAADLRFFSELEGLREPSAFAAYLAPLRKAEWVVYAKPPFGGPLQVLEYLGRYTQRVALSNQRLTAIEDGKVSFQWKDYRHHNRSKTMTLRCRRVHPPLPSAYVAARLPALASKQRRRVTLSSDKPGARFAAPYRAGDRDGSDAFSSKHGKTRPLQVTENSERVRYPLKR
jgi:hypothetical protein